MCDREEADFLERGRELLTSTPIDQAVDLIVGVDNHPYVRKLEHEISEQQRVDQLVDNPRKVVLDMAKDEAEKFAKLEKKIDELTDIVRLLTKLHAAPVELPIGIQRKANQG